MKTVGLLLLAAVLVSSSCVSKKKLTREQAHTLSLQSDSTSTHGSLQACNSKVANMEREELDMQKKMEAFTSSSAIAMENSKMTIADQAKRLRDLQNLIQGQKDILIKLKKTMADALINFKPDELSVELKDGKLYVSLQEKLLFKSGSAVVDSKGKDALAKLATVLNTASGISITIEGHTDNVPISGRYEDNWALSAERAISIVRLLTKDNKVDAHNIISSGRSEFFPVAENANNDGRAKNRRTEIILTPDLSQLFKIINQ